MIDHLRHNSIGHSREEKTIGNSETRRNARTDGVPREFPTRAFLNRIRSGMVELLDAYECARSVESDVWDFAVEISRLRDAGLAENEFRWLLHKKHVNQAREVTREKDNRRRFRHTGNLAFAKRTCFVLTEGGAVFARRLLRQVPAQISIRTDAANRERNHCANQNVPTWDALRRELRMNGRVIKAFKWSAKNQECILNSFEEDGWPPRVDDPIPPQPNQNQNQRLRDTIASLNRHHQNSLIRFRGDGSGRGVVWELVEDSRTP